MRTLVAAILALALAVPAMAEMPLTIGAMGTGYGATVEDKGEHFTSYWAGLRGVTVSEKTGIYGAYQHIGRNGGNGGHGMKALLVSGSDQWPWLYLMADLGIAFDLATDADGTETAAFTAGGGAAVSITEYISPYVYGTSYDTGDRFSWAIYFGFAITDIQKLTKMGK